MNNEMTSLQRWEATLSHEEPDYVPTTMFAGILALHFLDEPVDPHGKSTKEFATDPTKMARALSSLHEKTGIDSLYCLSDMGLLAEGYGVRIKYVKEEDVGAQLDSFPVTEAYQWEDLEVLDPWKDGRMRLYLDAAKILREKYGDKVPILVEISSPLTSATHICSMDNVFVQMLTEPDLLHKGLKTIADTTVEWIKAADDAGVHFVSYLLTRMTREVLTEDQYEEFGRPYDEYVFKKTKHVRKVTHACGNDPMMNIMADYNEKFPTSVLGVNWWDRGGEMKLDMAKKLYGDKMTLIAGVDHTVTLAFKGAPEIEAEIKDAMDTAMAGGGFILSPGCDASPKTPVENVKTFVKAARKYGKY